MNYEKPTLVYLADATTAIQGDPGGQRKVASNSDNIVQPNGMSSTAAGYPVEE